MSLAERAAYLAARFVTAAYFDVIDLGCDRRLTKPKDRA